MSFFKPNKICEGYVEHCESYKDCEGCCDYDLRTSAAIKEIATLQKDNDTLKAETKEAEGGVADMMELNDNLKAEVEKTKRQYKLLLSATNGDTTWLNAVERAEKAEAERDRLRGGVFALWMLLDDISTAGDMFKPEITGYFKYVNKKCEERSKVATSDGYNVFYEGQAINHKEG